MKFQVQVLSENEQERVHQTSLKILSDVGSRFYGERALPLLKRHGAKVDEDHSIAHIPPELVEQALSSSPHTFTLGARSPQFAQPLPIGESRYCVDGTAAFAEDFQTGVRRYGTRSDIIAASRIFQQLDLGIMAWVPTCASDAPAQSRPLHEFFAMASACSKHGQHELHKKSQVPYLVEGLSAIMGTETAFVQSRAYSLIYCPVAPLCHDGEMLDAYLELGEFQMPVMTMPMPSCGTTGPASLFGNICLANAENLASLVVYQLNNPGREIILGSATGILDFKRGAYLAGTPEMGLMSAALTVMARYYGLPSSAAGCTSDAQTAGSEAVMQKIFTTLPPAALDTDIIIGYGSLQSDQLLVLEQLVVDNEIAHLCQRVAMGIDASEGKEFYEDILKSQPGGHFLKSMNTRAAPRSGEFYLSDWVAFGSYENWLAAGQPTMYKKARERVTEILAAPFVDPLPGHIQSQLDEILLRADRELA